MLAFLGIGAQKAGTTWLHRMLSQHPQLYLPEAKELHYWDKQYPQAPIQAYLDFFHRIDCLEGEITPSYAILPISTIQVIHQYLPELKLIYSLRNPIERAWSAACMFLTKAQMELEEASDQWFLDHFYSKNSRLRGDYETSIRQWLSIYPRENLLLLDYDLIKSNPKLVLSSCCAHLGIHDFTLTQLETMLLSSKVFAGQGYQLRPKLKQALIDLYTPQIYSLSQYLNKDLSHWTQH
ncbi:sulfotransferase [uncultured Thiothrix sp.]|uniref:sulfotransferase family protein n=1 Tax=uncultured Thiothrix sp. TaxID=223185 RepID=UPI00262F54DA|nr:sulfotransferase [uncultured Thiothrix sp.]